MRFIELTKGYITCVDDEDYEWISQYKWFVNTATGIPYAQGWVEGRSVFMHRLIMGFPRFVDHANGDSLNNTRRNLRACTHGQNMMNRRKIKVLTSKFKGVSRKKRMKSKPWVASINRKHIGLFATQGEAAMAYDTAARKLYGEFACVNFPQVVESEQF